MGFEVKHDLSSGFSVKYWSVQDARINYASRECSFTILGYKDHATFKNKGAQATTRDVRVRGEEFDRLFPRDGTENFATQCYNAAAAKDPLFAEAQKA